MKQWTGKHVVVTTEFRGVFFGKLEETQRDEFGFRARLSQVRNCVYWDTNTRGFLGLAATGPTKGCRVGPAIPEILLEKVTAIAVCSDASISQWETEPWA